MASVIGWENVAYNDHRKTIIRASRNLRVAHSQWGASFELKSMKDTIMSLEDAIH